MIRGIERERNKMTLIRRGEEKKEGRRGKNKIVEKGGKGIVKKIKRAGRIVKEIARRTFVKTKGGRKIKESSREEIYLPFKFHKQIAYLKQCLAKFITYET